MKKFIFITLLCTIISSNIMLSMKRLAENSLESLCTKKIYTYHSPQKKTNFFERSYSDLDREMNLWGSPRKDVTHTEDYDMSCVLSTIPENTASEEDYDKILPRSSFSIAYEKIINAEDTELEKDFFQKSSECTKKAIALSLPRQTHTNTKNTKSVSNTDTETESETATEEDLYQPTFAYSEKDVEPTQTKTITKFFCTAEGCGKVFTAQNYLDKHMTHHNNLQYYKCTFDGCKEFFQTEGGLNFHISKLHFQKNYYCTFEGCGKSLKNQYNLNIHMQTHTGERPYACPFEGCNKTFNNYNYVINHTHTHTGEKPFNCQFCDKKFTRQTSLKAHIHKHTGEKPYPCTVKGCNQFFTDRSNRNRHSKTKHSFLCTNEGCGASFIKEGHLEDHMIEGHKEPLSYTCTIQGCNRSFTRLFDLKKHNKIKHTELCMFEKCGATFTTQSDLEKHMQTHNNNDDSNSTSKKSYTCKDCKAAFIDYSDFIQHKQQHGILIFPSLNTEAKDNVKQNNNNNATSTNKDPNQQPYVYDYESYVNTQREIFRMAHPEKDEDEFEIYIPNNNGPIDYQDYESNLVYK